MPGLYHRVNRGATPLWVMTNSFGGKEKGIDFKWKHWRLLLIALAFSIGAIVLFNLLWAGDFRGFWSQLSLRGIVMALLAVSGLWLLEAWRVQSIARAAGFTPDLGAVMRANLAAAFIAAITPAAAGGPPAHAYFLSRLGLGTERAAAVTTVRLLLNLAFFAVVSPPLFYLYRASLGLVPVLEWVVLAASVGLSGVVMGFFLMLYQSRWADAVVMAAGKVVPGGPEARRLKMEKWLSMLEGFRQSLAALLGGGWKSTAWMCLLTTCYWLGFFSLALILIESLELRVSYGGVLVRQLLLYFVVSYVPLPGASGVVELGLAALFSGVVPASFLPGFVAFWRLLTYHSNILLGGIIFWTLVRRPLPMVELQE